MSSRWSHPVHGAAWSDGTPIQRWRVRLDDGPGAPPSWNEKPARLGADRTRGRSGIATGRDPSPGDHSVVSRAVTRDGRVQPAADDASIKLEGNVLGGRISSGPPNPARERLGGGGAETIQHSRRIPTLPLMVVRPWAAPRPIASRAPRTTGWLKPARPITPISGDGP